MISEDGYYTSLPEIPAEIVDFIKYMKENKPDKKSFYDVVVHMSLFHYGDKSLNWLYESDDNMNSFAMAWILNNWIVCS